MANNYNGGSGSGRQQQGGPYDNVPPTQYLGHHDQNEQDPYGDAGYDDYGRPESFDVSYYASQEPADYPDQIYMNNSGQGGG
ncbi:hypothetical protein FBU59_000554, partial [Linderina macrospora]